MYTVKIISFTNPYSFSYKQSSVAKFENKIFKPSW